MYKCAKKLICFTVTLWTVFLLTACGGGSSDEGESTSMDTGTGTNTSTKEKPTFSSSAEANSLPSEAPSSESASSLITSPSVSSAYSRIARSSSEAASSQRDPSIDVTAPTVNPLHLYRLSERSITLAWDDATDDVGVAHYTIKRNGTLIAIIDFTAQMFADQNLLPATDYTYTITAFDEAGNSSGESPAFNARTLSLANQSPGSISSASAQSKSTTSSYSSFKSSSLMSASVVSQSSAIASSNKSGNISSTSAQSSQASSATNSSGVETITITWGHPSQREDGAFLELDDIAGYEIRYRTPNNTRYTHINLNGNRITEYVFTGPVQELEFEIAVFDTTGLYSRYVKITR